MITCYGGRCINYSVVPCNHQSSYVYKVAYPALGISFAVVLDEVALRSPLLLWGAYHNCCRCYIASRVFNRISILIKVCLQIGVRMLNEPFYKHKECKSQKDDVLIGSQCCGTKRFINEGYRRMPERPDHYSRMRHAHMFMHDHVNTCGRI